MDGSTEQFSQPLSKSKSNPLKRHRVFRACEQCRTKKSKCDGKSPSCSTCESLSQQCTYGESPKRRGLVAGSHSRLEQKAKVLETLLGLLVTTVQGSEMTLKTLVEKYKSKLVDDDSARETWSTGPVMQMIEAMGLLEIDPKRGRPEAILRSPSSQESVERRLFSATPAPFFDSTAGQESQHFMDRIIVELPPRNRADENSTRKQALPPTVRSSVRAPSDISGDSSHLLDIYFTYTHVWFPILDKFDIFRTLRSVSSHKRPQLY